MKSSERFRLPHETPYCEAPIRNWKTKMDYIKQAENIKAGEVMVYFTGELSRSREIEIRENARTGSAEAPINQMADYFWDMYEQRRGFLIQRSAPTGVKGFEYLYVGARNG